MKNKAFYRGISVLLAVLICLSSLMGAGVPVAYAAPVQEEVIPIAYPREGDTNFSADWGHDTLQLMNGWTVPATTQFTFRAMGLYSGTICYCIEPGVAQVPGDTLTQFGEDFWENYPADYNSTIAPYDIKLLIGRIFQYGYTGNVSSYWYSQEESGEFIAHAIATQLVIWETVVGERDSDFNHVDPGSYDAVLEIVRSGHPLREKILAYYNSIVSNVQKHSKLPSFMSKTSGKAQNIELTWNGTQYTASLTDANGVLENYAFTVSDPSITLAVSENVLTLSTPNAPSGTVSITADKMNAKRSGVVVWSDGVIDPSGTIQDVVVYSAEVTDPIKGYLNANASYGSLKIEKTSEDGIVDGLTFAITGDGYSATVVLDSTGSVLIENLKPGIYQVAEQSIDRYIPQSVQTVTVVSGQTVTASFHNALKRGSLQVTKTAEDGHIANVRFKLSGTALDGSNVELYAVTDETGVAVFENVLISGDTPYVLEEINTADQYVVPVKQHVTISWNTVTHAQVENKLKYGSLKVTKTSEDGLVAGIQFKLSGTSLSGHSVEQYATTDDSGIAAFNNILISGNVPYILEEVSTAEKYIVPEKQNVTIHWNSVSQIYVQNNLKYGGLKVTKTSEDGFVSGIRFKLSGTALSGQPVELYAVTDENGVAVFNSVLVSGSTPYVLEEVNTDQKYVVPAEQNITIAWNVVTETSVCNALKRGDLKVAKTSEDGLVAGVKFKLSGISLSGKAVELYATTDASGIATFTDVLISGSAPYVLEEVNTELKYVVPVTQNVTINWNEVTNTSVHNELKRGTLKVTKTSEDSFVEGVRFKLSGVSLSGETVELYATTDNSGVATFADVLISGATPYVLEEVNTAQHYIVPEKLDVVIEWNTVTEASIYNELKRGDLRVTKTSEDGLNSGIRFKLSGTAMNGQAVELYAVTDDSGVATFAGVLIAGATPYVLEEVDTELKYVVPNAQNVSVNWNEVTDTSVHNELKRGSLKVTKTSEDRLVEGMKFKLSGTSLSGEAVELYATTDKNGIATFTDVLISGSTPYVLEEIDTAQRYIVPEKQDVVIQWNTVTEASVYNELKRGDVKVTKDSEDGLNSGIRFRLYGTSLSGTSVNLYATTGEDGIAVFEDVLIGSNYTLVEVNTSNKYVIPEPQNVTVNWNEVTECTVENILKKFKVEALKIDGILVYGEPDENMPEELTLEDEPPIEDDFDLPWPYGCSQGDATLEGAVYGMYLDGVLLDTYTTDANGRFTTKYYPCGDGYYLLELSPSEGYMVDPWEYYIYAWPGSQTVELSTQYMELYEEIIRGQIEIVKHSDDGQTKFETPEVGAEFEVYLKSAGSYEAAEEWERDHLVVDEDGFATSKKLPYGTYVVTQLSGWEGCDYIEPFEVTISEHEKMYRYIINNAEFKSYIKVTKTDATTGKTIPYAGAAFQIYDPEGNLVTMQYTYPQVTVVDTFYTNADGTLITPEKLPYGKGYSLVEVQATDGYVLDSTPVYFDVTRPDSEEEDNILVIHVTKGNMPQLGTVTVTKTGEIFSSVTEKDGIYQPVYETAGLEGAVFEIYAAEDVVTPDGTVRYSKDEKVDTVTTGSDAKATSKELYLGKYYLKEIEAPYGMLLNGETVAFELTYAGQEVSVTSTAVTMTNERQKIILDLVKAMEQDETFKLGMNGEIGKVSFGLYAAEDLVASDGTKIPKDGLLEIAQCSAEGKAVFSTDVPVGSKLYVKEYTTDAAYLPSDTTYPVEFVYAGQEVAAVIITVNNGETIQNELIRGSVEGLKKDEDGNVVAGAEFGLFWADTTEFTKENAILIATSDDAGVFRFENLPALKFIIKELSAPEQFILSDEIFEVEISEDAQVIAIEAINEFITGNVTVTKTDKDTAEKLSGAVFEVYVDSDGDKVFGEKDALYGTLTETEAGVYLLEALRYGGYFLHEKQSPVNYNGNSEYHYFAITEDGQTVTVETTQGKGFENEAYKGIIQIIKKDAATGEILSGVEFGLFDLEGNELARGKTDDAGVLVFEDIRFGKYEIRELTPKEGYKKNETVTQVEITEDGQTVTVELTNERIPEPENPKTGDDTNLLLWFGLMFAAIVGLVVLFLFKRRALVR